MQGVLNPCGAVSDLLQGLLMKHISTLVAIASLARVNLHLPTVNRSQATRRQSQAEASACLGAAQSKRERKAAKALANAARSANASADRQRRLEYFRKPI